MSKWGVYLALEKRKENKTKSSLKKDKGGKTGFLCGEKEVKREKERRKFFRESAESGKQENSKKEGILLGQSVGL